MQKSLTLYPRYITDGSSFAGILSANGTGQDYRTLSKDKGHEKPDSLVVGTIGFDTSALYGKSKACVLNEYTISANVWVDPERSDCGVTNTLRPRLITNYAINNTALTVNSFIDQDSGFGSIGWMNAEKSGAQGRTVTLLSDSRTDVIGYEKMLGFYLTMREWQWKVFFTSQKSYMSNLSANVKYTARYYARFYNENGAKLIETQTVDGGNAPIVTEEVLSACQKEGYRIFGWRANDGNIYSVMPVREDTDINFMPVYERIYFRVTVPEGNGGAWRIRTFDETAQEWVDRETQYLDNNYYCYIAYGEKLKIESTGFINPSEDLKIIINGTEKTFDGSGGNMLKIFETEKLTENITVSSVEAVPVYFDITTSSNTGGKVTPSFQTLRASEYSVAFTPDTGYRISAISKNGSPVTVTDESGMTITETAQENVNYEVTFVKIKIPITITHDGGVSVSGETLVDYGDIASLKITALEGYSIDTVSLNGSVAADFFKKQESYTIKKPCLEPISIDITSSNNLVTITALECENGQIRGDIGTFIKGKGTLEIYAQPSLSYSFESWVGVDWTTREVTIDSATAEDSYTISATFKKYDCKVEAGFSEYFFIGEYGDLVYGGTVEIVGASDISQPYGNVTEGYAQAGTDVTFIVHPDDGFEVERIKWTIAGQEYSTTESSVTFENILSDREVWIKLAAKKINVTVVVDSPDGKLTGGTHLGRREYTQEFKYGGSTTLEVIPDDGYYFIKWSDDVYNAERDFLIPTHDVTLTAYFRRYEYDIDIAAENHGKIELTTDGVTAEGKATAKHFDDVLLKITPDFGWRVSEILLDGVPITAQATITRHEARYTLEGVDKAHGFEVRYEPKMYTNGRKLIDYYPPVIASIKDMQQIVGSQQPMIEELWDAVSFVTENQFIDSSTEEGVKEWEDELGIVPSVHDTFEQRKKRLKNRWVPDNRFTIPWLWEWLKRVSERDDIRVPTVNDYVLTVRLPAIVDYFTILNELEMYKPANIGVNAQISLEDGTQKLTAGVGIVSKFKITLESEAIESGN